MRMREKAFANTISAFYDAVLDERRWTEALKAVAEYVGAVDVGYLLANKKTGEPLSVAWWGCFSGNSAEYLTHYCKIDPFRVAQESASCGSWNRASEILPRSLLSQDEWYNDFILKGGVCDILGAKLHEDASHVVLIGFQSPIGDSRSFPRNQTALRRLTEPLCQAARLHVGLQEIGYRSAIAEEALNELDAGVIVADGDGRVLRTNQLADAILSQGDGLAIRNGRLAAPRSFETASLTYSHRCRVARERRRWRAKGTRHQGVCFAAGFGLWVGAGGFRGGFRGRSRPRRLRPRRHQGSAECRSNQVDLGLARSAVCCRGAGTWN